MCPKYSDVPVLAPIVTKVMNQHRLTDLVFRRNSIHVVCQQGLIHAWSRPVRIKDNPTSDSRLLALSESMSNPPTKMTRIRPIGPSASHPTMSPSSSVRSPIPSVSDGPDGGVEPYRTDPYNHRGSVAERVVDRDEPTGLQQPPTSHRSTAANAMAPTVTTTPGAPRHQCVSSRIPSDHVFSSTHSSLDYEYVTGPPVSRIHGRGVQPPATSSADV
ncbi:unnamed protein product [Echinostoma caproni]|uniref:Uncharacterized protein n=1 Tax=Echinostoma caproni TaxID=27848 RepID=A0A183B276_9TREM|nr:unnamed protein product [Echinostoma caproni]